MREGEARAILGHLAQAIAGIAPPGIAKHEATWEAVDPADRAFVMALNTWQRSGLDADKARLRVAYRALVAAWEQAAGRFTELEELRRSA